MSAAPAPGRALPGFGAPAVGFDEPMAMLEACHERVERTLALLQRLRPHVATHGADADARQAARDVLRYFDIAAPLHHDDEERHVFPLLLRTGPPAVAALVQRLQADHRAMAADWAAARVPLAALADGALQAFSPEHEALFDRFAQRYGAHIAAEEGTAYPAALAQLDAQALAAMGQEMAGRRGQG